MTRLDWLIVGTYLAGLVAFGLFAARRVRSTEDYFLASRSARWPTIGLALIASNISSTALVGLAGAAYAYGISVYDYEWTAAVILALYCVFLLPQVLASRVFTMPEFLERRFDARARTWLSAITLFLNVFVDCAGALYSGAVVCRLLAPALPLAAFTTVLAAAAGLYTIAGGLRAVLRTEVVQAGVLFGGAAVVAWRATAAAGGWPAVVAGVDPAMLSLLRPASDPAVPWPGLVTGIPLLGFYYWCANQMIVQRVLSASDLDQGRSGVLFAGLLKLPVLFLMVLPGTAALLVLPHGTRADLVYAGLIREVLPAGLAGLLVAGFAAATMTAVASTLNSVSTLVTMDLLRGRATGGSDERTLAIGRTSTGAALAVAMAWAPQLAQLPSLWQYLQAVLAYVVPPVVVLFVAGLAWPGANAAGAQATLKYGSAAGLALFAVNVVLGLTHVHFLYVAPLLALIDTAILVLVSRAHPAPLPPGAAALLFSRQAFAAESARLRGLPGWRNYRRQALALVALAAAIVLAFR
jgi:SSS family solute:Na+ symporter